jgi:hypothetical protein
VRSDRARTCVGSTNDRGSLGIMRLVLQMIRKDGETTLKLCAQLWAEVRLSYVGAQ